MKTEHFQVIIRELIICTLQEVVNSLTHRLIRTKGNAIISHFKRPFQSFQGNFWEGRAFVLKPVQNLCPNSLFWIYHSEFTFHNKPSQICIVCCGFYFFHAITPRVQLAEKKTKKFPLKLERELLNFSIKPRWLLSTFTI